MFGGGQCARCFQPIPASALVMRSGELTFHPHCFSCQVRIIHTVYTYGVTDDVTVGNAAESPHALQECDVKLTPGNRYCMHGQNLYCQSHYHGNGTVPQSLESEATQKEGKFVLPPIFVLPMAVLAVVLAPS